MTTPSLQELVASSCLSGGNANYLEDIYEQFLKDPHSVGQEWQSYFQKLPRVNGHAEFDISHADIREQFAQLAQQTQKAVISGDVAYERQLLMMT